MFLYMCRYADLRKSMLHCAVQGEFLCSFSFVTPGVVLLLPYHVVVPYVMLFVLCSSTICYLDVMLWYVLFCSVPRYGVVLLI